MESQTPGLIKPGGVMMGASARLSRNLQDSHSGVPRWERWGSRRSNATPR